jgi:hypothetical protein
MVASFFDQLLPVLEVEIGRRLAEEVRLLRAAAVSTPAAAERGAARPFSSAPSAWCSVISVQARSTRFENHSGQLEALRLVRAYLYEAANALLTTCKNGRRSRSAATYSQRHACSVASKPTVSLASA